MKKRRKSEEILQPQKTIEKTHKSGRSDVMYYALKPLSTRNTQLIQYTPTTIPTIQYQTTQERQNNTSSNPIELAQRVFLFSADEFFISYSFFAFSEGYFSVATPFQFQWHANNIVKSTEQENKLN